MREQIEAPRPPAYHEQLEKRSLPARQALGAEAADAAVETGHSLALEEAVDLALTIDLGEKTDTNHRSKIAR